MILTHWHGIFIIGKISSKFIVIVARLASGSCKCCNVYGVNNGSMLAVSSAWMLRFILVIGKFFCWVHFNCFPSEEIRSNLKGFWLFFFPIDFTCSRVRIVMMVLSFYDGCIWIWRTLFTCCYSIWRYISPNATTIWQMSFFHMLEIIGQLYNYHQRYVTINFIKNGRYASAHEKSPP